jgi:SecD-like export protein
MKTDVQPAGPQPAEVLIPEARAHQRQRYTRAGVVLVVTALVLAALIAAAVALWGDAAGGKSQSSPPPAGAAGGFAGRVDFRPVLCLVPPYSPGAPAPVTPGALSCSAASSMTAQNLNVKLTNSSPVGFNSNNVPVDSALAGAPSTKPSADDPAATVLLPVVGPQRPGAVRYLLGPAQMTSASVASARLTETSYRNWQVDFTTKNGALWDKVTQENFHQELGIELNGVVYSAPLIEPQTSSFYSFEGKGEISGNLTKAQAVRLAAALQPHRGS